MLLTAYPLLLHFHNTLSVFVGYLKKYFHFTNSEIYLRVQTHHGERRVHVTLTFLQIVGNTILIYTRLIVNVKCPHSNCNTSWILVEGKCGFSKMTILLMSSSSKIGKSTIHLVCSSSSSKPVILPDRGNVFFNIHMLQSVTK